MYMHLHASTFNMNEHIYNQFTLFSGVAIVHILHNPSQVGFSVHVFKFLSARACKFKSTAWIRPCY